MLEFYYQNFSEIFYYSIPVVGIMMMAGRSILFHTSGGRYRSKNINNAPTILRIKSWFNNTRIGKLSLLHHVYWERFREKHLANQIVYLSQKNSRLMIYRFIFGGTLSFILTIVGIEYLFKHGYSLLIDESPEFNLDKINYIIKYSKDSNLANEIIQKEIKEKLMTNNITTLDLTQYGKLLAGVMQEEISFQCYYIAYLKNREIGTNSDLKFKTYLA